MGFSGYLIKVLGNTDAEVPLNRIKLASYKTTPSQRMESEAGRAVTGLLHRTTVEHTSTKIEFETPPMTNTELQEFLSIFRDRWSNELERRLDIMYYNEEEDDYILADVYMPDIEYLISRIDTTTNTIYYDSFRVAFIEY